MAERARSDVLLVGDAADQGSLHKIAGLLRELGLDAETLALDPTGTNESEIAPAIDAVKAVAVVLGSARLTDPIRSTWSRSLAAPRPLFAVILPGSDPGLAREFVIDESRSIDLRERLDDPRRLKAFAEQLERLGVPPADESASHPVPPPDELPGWDQFDDGAQRALTVADAIRSASSSRDLHMEHLLAGLLQQDPGPLRQVTETAGLDEARVKTILEDAAKGPLPSVADLHVQTLDRLPPVTSHAREALVAARRIASERGASKVETRHLTAGALSIEDCTPIQALREAHVDPELALTWDQPLTAKASAQTDQPTLDDLLGYTNLVAALTELITSEETTFPLTIAVSAPWGGGKSSVMRMLQRGLRPDAQGPKAKRWVIVNFPAWRYDTGEQLWAAMAKVTFDAARVGIGRWDRIRLRWAVERPRLPILSSAARILVAGVGGVLGYGIGVLVATVAAPQIEDTTAGVVGGLSAAAAVTRAFWESASDPFKRAVASIAAQPGISASDGFSPDEELRIRALMKVLLTERAGVAIFIDDLDRCTPRNLVRVIEVVNQIFVASADAAAPPTGEDPGVSTPPEPGVRRLIFIMGMDRELVARGIEAEYEKLLDHLAEAGATGGEDFGLAFLDKIIQLWVTLPTPTQAGLDLLLRKVAGLPEATDPAREAAVQSIGKAMADRIRDLPASDRPRVNAELNRIVAEATPEQRTAARLARLAVRSSLPPPKLADDPRLWEALKVGADCLEPNPRQRKRFNNAFRLQFYLAQDLSLSRDQYGALAKVVAIRLRWPRLGHALDQHPDLLRALERRANGRLRVADIDWRRAVAQRRRTPEWFHEDRFRDLPELCAILKVERPEQALSRLPDEDITRVA